MRAGPGQKRARRFRRCAVAGAVLPFAVALLTGCGDLQFQNDHRLHFTAPVHDLAKVTLPLTLAWTMRDPSPRQASYAVFVDRAPIKPGQSLKAVFADQSTCKTDPACPTTDDLASRNVYVTADPTLSIARVPILPAGTSRKIHTFTVILIDRTGHRIGEAAWERDVEIPKSLVAS
ncbi:MAG TPA: hypothetical protein VHE83_03610 [Mycobacteriales bacterium]|nr:hypothetical protein [Mycobacteriales bacterium]